MTQKQFINHVYHTRLHVHIPALGGARLAKINFMENGRFSEKKLNDHLIRLYETRINNNRNENERE